jgi:hypothetical protein
MRDEPHHKGETYRKLSRIPDEEIAQLIRESRDAR